MHGRSSVKVRGEPRSTFTFYAWSFIHCLYFIYACKFYMRSHGKITRQWKSTVTLSFPMPGTVPIETILVSIDHEREIKILTSHWKRFLLFKKPLTDLGKHLSGLMVSLPCFPIVIRHRFC